MKPRTLRTDLTLAYAGVLALLLTALGAAYYHVFALQLDADATAELASMTRAVHGYIRFEGGAPVLAYDPDDPDQAAFVQEATKYYQVYDGASGRLLTQSAAVQPLGLHYTPGEVRAFIERPAVSNVQTDQRRIRFTNTVITPGPGEVYLLQVGIPLDARDAALRRFLTLLIWSLPIGLAIVLALGRWMAGRALIPLARLATAARTISVTDLHRRLPVRGVDDELDDLANTFNRVVAQLERAVAEMKQFSAAMAHEIRTPLTAIRADMELSLADRRTPEEQREATVSRIEEVDKLTRLTGQLLMLARAEAGDVTLAREPIQLTGLCRSVVESLEPVAQAKAITLTSASDGPVEIIGDPGWMERLVVNLVDNALKFTPTGGEVAISVLRDGSKAKLSVQDSGVGIPADALPHVFDRFYQVDAARSQAHDGAGLGLSFVKWIAERHAGTVDVVSRAGHGTIFTVNLPIHV